MSQILLVDDELLVIEAIKMNIDWDAVGVDEVFLCDNGYQAKQMIAEHDIKLVVSDVQMPGMNGIELGQWIRNEYPDIIVMYLSGYAEFEYAKAALSMGAEDYILKPVDYKNLQSRISELILKVQKNQKNVIIKQQFEIHQGDLLKEWVQFALHTTEDFYGTALEELLNRFHLDLPLQNQFVIIWLNLNSIIKWEQLEWLKKELTKIRNIGEREITIANLTAQKIMALVGMARNSGRNDAAITREFMAELVTKIEVPCCCYLSELLNAEQLIPVIRKISEREKRNVMYQNKVILVGNRNIPLAEKNFDIDYKRWSMLLETHDIGRLESSVEFAIHSIIIDGNMSIEVLQDLYNHFVQMMYYYIGEEYDTRITIIQDEKLSRLQTNALRSVEEFRAYYHYFLQRVSEYQKAGASNDVISEVKKYIDKHLGEKISRSEIADYVFLNENYLSRLFHKEVGCSISNYILEKRIALSKKLLIQTKLSVSEIGERIGYDTTTYFIRIFKQETGKTPNEFRKDMRI